MTTTTQQAVQRRLAQIRDREQAATKGPWFDQYEYDGERTVCVMRGASFCVNKALHAPGEPPDSATKENGRFIAASRMDIPALLDLVSVLLEEREAAKGKGFSRCEYERLIASADAALARFAGETTTNRRPKTFNSFIGGPSDEQFPVDEESE